MPIINPKGNRVPNNQELKDSANNEHELAQALKDLSKLREKYAASDDYNRLPASLKAIFNTDNFLADILYDDVKWTRIPERDNLEYPINSSNGFVQDQFVLLVEATGFIAMHLKRWIEEELTPELRCWYRLDKPFVNRLIPIQKTCENLLNILPARLPNFERRFIEKYEELKCVALEADSCRTCDLENGIHNFKSASEAFHKTILAILSEAYVYVKQKNMANKKTKPVNLINAGTKKKRGRSIDQNRDQEAKELMDLYNRGGKTWNEVAIEKGIKGATAGQNAQQKVRRYKQRQKNKKNIKNTSK
ncbi:hypothetical protein ACFL3G_00710 [Planctomycetota bacterium]